MRNSQVYIYASKLSQGNVKVFGLVLGSTIAVTFLRALGPLMPNFDLSIQLEATHRLVQGLGLTSTFFSTPFENINLAPIPQYLTWWPPGFPLITALLVSLGLSFATALKIIYGFTTLVGSIGWAIIASLTLTQPIRFGSISIPMQFLVAVLIPIYFTPPWQGTDSLLWAIVPFFILLLSSVKARKNRTRKNVVFYPIVAGILFGLSYTMRYASLFLLIASLAILLQIHWPSIKYTLKSYLSFVFSSLIFIASVNIYVFISKQSTALPEYLGTQNPHHFLASITTDLSEIFRFSSSMFNTLLGMRFLDRLLELLQKFPFLINLFNGICLIFGLILPLYIFFLLHRKKYVTQGIQISIGLTISLISLDIFLIAASFFSNYIFFADQRYYLAVGPTFLLILYGFISQFICSDFTSKLIKFATSAVLVFSLIYNLIFNPLASLASRSGLSYLIFGYELNSVTYPSNQVISNRPQSSAYLAQLRQKNPDAVFYVYNLNDYIANGNPGYRAIPPAGFWQNAYVDQALKVVWVMRDFCPTGVCTFRSFTNGFLAPASVGLLPDQPGLNTIATFPDEQVRVLMADLPSGYKFINDGQTISK